MKKERTIVFYMLLAFLLVDCKGEFDAASRAKSVKCDRPSVAEVSKFRLLKLTCENINFVT